MVQGSLGGLLGQQLSELRGVADRVIAIAVVQQQMGLGAASRANPATGGASSASSDSEYR